MNGNANGIHHITAIAGDPQENLDFYAGLLGLRMVKKTVNFDDPGTYHFYYGDYPGTPGTILTFFPWGSGYAKGRGGAGQAVTIRFAVPRGALGFWEARLAGAEIRTEKVAQETDGDILRFRDPDGLALELVETGDGREGYGTEHIPGAFAVRGFHSVLLEEEDPDASARFLESALGFRMTEGPAGALRFASGDGAPGTLVDIRMDAVRTRGRMGAGAIHHVAFRASDDAEQTTLRERLMELGVRATDVIDRQYFRSVYFREPGHVLFEIATDPPGFTVDEPLETLGTSLRLPPWYEEQRERIESVLIPVSVPAPFENGRKHAAA